MLILIYNFLAEALSGSGNLSQRKSKIKYQGMFAVNNKLVGFKENYYWSNLIHTLSKFVLINKFRSGTKNICDLRICVNCRGFPFS